MENASKALLIAGGILLSMIVLSLFVLMINNLTTYQQTQIISQREAETISFNNQYNGYMRDDVSGADIISLINKVVFYNRTRSTAGTEDTDNGEDYDYEPITLKINFNGKKENLAKGENKLFKNDLTFSDTTTLDSKIKGGFDYINNLLNTYTMPEAPTSCYGSEQLSYEYRRSLKIHYSDGILKDLLENYDSSDSIFSNDFTSMDEKKKRKCFSDFNVITGKVYFPLFNKGNKSISVDTLNKWWEDYFSSKATKKDSNNKTIKEELDYYYEYTQFQRGLFKYIPKESNETYSQNTGRIIYMEFEFTGNFV